MNKNSFEPLNAECVSKIWGETARIDDTDIVEDFLTDDIFQENIYSSEKNEHIGFIAGYPSFVYVGHVSVEISLVFPTRLSMEGVSLWRTQVIENLVGIRETNVGLFFYLNKESQLVYVFNISDDRIKLSIYHVK